jgi:alpha-1,2-mannosyltransferase
MNRDTSPAKNLFTVLALGVVPLVLVLSFVLGAIGHHFAFDFRTFWQAARLVVHGHSPYPSASFVAHHHPAHGDYEYFVYPAPFAVGVLPLAVLPFAPAATIWTVLLLASVLGTLAVLGVRDWRCYGLVLATVPALSAVRLGAVTPVLMLLAACAWRYRNDPLKVGAAVAGAIVLKLFLWPLVLWLLVTRRSRAAGVAVGGAVLASALAWAALRLDGLRQYPALLRTLAHVEGRESYSLVALADRLHLSDPSTTWIVLAIPVALVLVAVCFTRAASLRDDAAFATAIGLALVLTPIVWLNYFALLAVPLAVRRPRLSLDWLLLLLFWATPSPEPKAHPLWQVAIALAVTTVVVVRAQFSAATLQRGPYGAGSCAGVRRSAQSFR